MINRSFTRTILNGDETTEETKSLTSDALGFALTTADYFYMGFKQPFITRYFLMKTAAVTAGSVVVEYWNGSEWKRAEDVVDETACFTQSGFLSWQVVDGAWQKSMLAPLENVNSENENRPELEYFWARVSVSVDRDAGTELEAVVNLFCTNTLFCTYYPDLLYDTRYLPSGKTNFLEQYLAAKDHVVRRMRQMGKITDEGDILDINDVAVAAVHATAYIILNPLKDDESRAAAKVAYAACEAELSRGTQAVDQNKDGRLSSDEKFSGTNWLSR